MAKSVLVAYVLWAVGGWFGLHHLYLRRDLHAFLTWSTLGGYFGIGLLRDLARIPEYVADCNEDEKFIGKFVQQLKENEKVLQKFNPKFNLFGTSLSRHSFECIQFFSMRDAGTVTRTIHNMLPSRYTFIKME